MKKITYLVALLGLASMAGAATYVHPYTRSDGSYVQGHYRSAPDGNPYNNYSTTGNINPYTGSVGTHNPYGQPSTRSNSGASQSCWPTCNE